MAMLPEKIKKRITAAIFSKADKHGYATRGRVENGQFMDELVDDPDIGQVLREYMPPERVRTYIKDGVLNAYTKTITKRVLKGHDPEQIIRVTYHIESTCIHIRNDISVCSASSKQVYIISRGTVLKWETAMRRALEFIASTPKLSASESYPSICLQLAVINDEITEGDKKHITSALAAIGVCVYFCTAL